MQQKNWRKYEGKQIILFFANKCWDKESDKSYSILDIVIKFVNSAKMGFDVEDFPNPLLVAIKCQSATQAAFHRNITTAFNNNCDALMTPIYSD